jgi:hypothetical protein
VLPACAEPVHLGTARLLREGAAGGRRCRLLLPPLLLQTPHLPHLLLCGQHRHLLSQQQLLLQRCHPPYHHCCLQQRQLGWSCPAA